MTILASPRKSCAIAQGGSGAVHSHNCMQCACMHFAIGSFTGYKVCILHFSNHAMIVPYVFRFVHSFSVHNLYLLGKM